MNAITDLPAEVASPAADIDLKKLDLQDVALARFGPWRADVARVKDELGSLVLDLSIPARITEAKSLRERLINQPRANVRAVSKALKSKLTAVSKAVGAEEDAAVKAYDEAEQLITPQIEAREAEIEAEKEAKRLAEEARKQKHRDAIATIRAYQGHCKGPGMTAERIANGIDMLRAAAIGPELEEFEAEARAAQAETLQAMEALHAEAKAREDEQARMAALRAEQERMAAELASEQAAWERKKAADWAALQRQREELEAQQRAAATSAIVEGAALATEPHAARRDRDFAASAPLSGKVETEVTPGSGQPEASPPVGRTCYVGDMLASPDTWQRHEFPPAPDTSAPQEVGQAEAQGMEANPSPCQAETSLLERAWDGLTVDDTDRSIETSEDEARPYVPSEHYLGPAESDEPPPAGTDIELAAMALTEHIAQAFDSKFPSHPKPSQEWWAELRQLARAVDAVINDEVLPG